MRLVYFSKTIFRLRQNNYFLNKVLNIFDVLNKMYPTITTSTKHLQSEAELGEEAMLFGCGRGGDGMGLDGKWRP